MACRSEAIKARTLPLWGISGVPGRSVVTASLTDGNKEEFDHLQSYDGMHDSTPRVHERPRPNVCAMPNRLLIRSDALMGPFSRAAELLAQIGTKNKQIVHT